ncbi:hypothetical protein DFR67_103453 [Williamsia limnetica]|uniref:Uncharacterized protein n=1 Tax=Williamsia limnetica TaxID=882452 RepID=A0A318RS71_WILLI|nr:DUF6339 family protein [Williamsia limnetica]PYE19540.1 hypothetical protein DFR67_103453 [Williamsia limnetica]
MTELWPRLSTGVGVIGYRKLEGISPDELAGAARNKHPQMTYAASGGHRIGESGVAKLAEAIRSTAAEYGYPAEVGSADHIAFDRAAAEQMHQLMDITAVEAGNRGVWTFLAVVAMPDVTRWRFSGDNLERWIATDLTRHMFSRLWWQAATFGVKNGESYDYSLLRRLTESDLNQITERRFIAGVTPLARSIARVLTEGSQEGGRRQALRGATPRLRRLMAFIDFSVLTDDQLDDRVRALLHEAASRKPSVGISGS